MMRKLIAIISLFILLPVFAFSQINEPVKWNIALSKITNSGDAEITFTAKIENKWHIYGTSLPKDGPIPTTFNFENLVGVDLVGKIRCSTTPIEKFEPTFGMTLKWYEQSVKFTQRIKVEDSLKFNISGNVEFMACNDVTCLPPAREAFKFERNTPQVSAEAVSKPTKPQKNGFKLKALDIKKRSDTKDYWKPVAKDLNKYGAKEGVNVESESFWSIFLKGLIGGFIAIFAPCIWPTIPTTISFFLKRNKDKKKGISSAILYGLSIIFIYEILGIFITIIFGASALNSLSTNAIFNVTLFIILVLFAISFFGGFNIELPASWSSKTNKKADTTSGIISILFMALTLVVVSFSCTGPIIGTLLVSVANDNFLAPAIGMLGFAIALSLPFTIFALFPSRLDSLRKNGSWLNTIKVTLGFIELAFALKFLSVADMAYGWRILDREVFLVLWIVIFAFLGLYLLGKIKFDGDDEISHISVFRLFLSMITFAFVMYMIPGLFGAPLKAISAFSPPLSTQDFNLKQSNTHAKFDDYEQGMEYAKKYNKPVVVDFSGFGCVNCRKMEVSVWNDPEVSSLLNNDYVLISLYVDDKKELNKPYTVVENNKETSISTWGEKWSYLQRIKFGANVQPFYVLLDNNGDVLNHAFAFSENKSEFIKFLRTGLANYNDKKNISEENDDITE